MDPLKAELRAQLCKPGSDRAFTWCGKIHVTVYLDDNMVVLFKWNPELALYRDEQGVIQRKQGKRDASVAQITHSELRKVREALGLPADAPAKLRRGALSQTIVLRGVCIGAD